MKQKNILAGFTRIEDAEKAKEALSQSGFSELQIEPVSPYPGDSVDQLTNPIAGNIKSLTDLTLAADTGNESAGILNSSSEGASGMSDGNPFEIDQNILLTVVTNDRDAPSAEKIIEKNRGQL